MLQTFRFMYRNIAVCKPWLSKQRNKKFDHFEFEDDQQICYILDFIPSFVIQFFVMVELKVYWHFEVNVNHYWIPA